MDGDPEVAQPSGAAAILARVDFQLADGISFAEVHRVGKPGAGVRIGVEKAGFIAVSEHDDVPVSRCPERAIRISGSVGSDVDGVRHGQLRESESDGGYK